MKGKLRYIFSALVGIAMLGFVEGHAIDVQVPAPKALPKDSKAIKPPVKPSLLPAALGAPLIRSAALLPNIPFDVHCAAPASPTFGGRAEVKVYLPNHPEHSSVRAVLVVNTGMTEDRKEITLYGKYETTVASNDLQFSFRGACDDRCIEYRIEGITFNEVKNIKTGNLKACVPRGM